MLITNSEKNLSTIKYGQMQFVNHYQQIFLINFFNNEQKITQQSQGIFMLDRHALRWRTFLNGKKEIVFGLQGKKPTQPNTNT